MIVKLLNFLILLFVAALGILLIPVAIGLVSIGFIGIVWSKVNDDEH